MRDSRSRAALVTALDLLAIACFAAAIVLALGAQSRFRLLGIIVSIKDPLRPFIAAVGAGVVRLIIAGRLPMLPSLRASEGWQARLGAERDRIAQPSRLSRELKYYALAAAAGSLVWLVPQLLHIRRVPDVGDPIFSAWRLAAFAHQLTHDPAHLFDGNIFYPARYTLTYSDSTFLQGLLATPFLVAGADPLVVSNVLLIAGFPLCALTFFYVAWRLTSDARAAFVAGLLGGLWAFHLEHYSHLELQYFCFIPLAVLAVLRMVAHPTRRNGLTLGGWVALQWLASMYFGVMLLVFLVPVAGIAVAAWGLKPYRRSLAAIATAGVVIAVAFGALSWPYMRSQQARGERPLRTVAQYSAIPSDYGRPHSRLASYQWITRVDNKPERELFSGVTPLILSAVALAPPVGVATFSIGAGAAVAFDGSLGLNGLIYDELYRYALPFRGMRVPARFAIFAGAGLILLSAYGCRRLFALAHGRTPRAALLVVVALAVLIDLRATLHLEDFPATIPSIYSEVTPDMVLAEFPMVPDATIAFMYFSTTHWAKLLNGHSGYLPDAYVALTDSMDRFPVDGTLDKLRSLGVTHVTVNCTLWANPARCEGVLTWLDKLEKEGAVRLVKADLWEKRPVRLYAIR